MPAYTPPIEEIDFLLRHVLDFDAQMAALPNFSEINSDLAVDILSEAGKFCAEVLEPLNAVGDKHGCTLLDGSVTTPPGMANAYRAFAAAGWTTVSADIDYGGQGLSRVIQILFDEMLSSANLSFGLFAGLTRGAVEAIGHHGSDALKAAYLPKMISGEWSGAMALTEAGAGTDLGLLTTKALPRGDGTYGITGTKIFISSGDHDFGGNVIHLVLARLPDAPQGVKGISLFLVPKFLLNSEGECGERNRFTVASLEHKMGIHAQPTCMMSYEGATGWLLGEAGRGLNAMFTMMNAERLFVGIQGLGVAEIAGQKARRYAEDRLQGRSSDGTRAPVAIVEHADVRRMLLEGKSFVEAGRALAVWVALQMDIAASHPEPVIRKKANGFVELLTPVVKAAFTDLGFEATVTAQQVFGGHGYIVEWGMEQYVRDARITQIYEGTNGVQALDLLSRKLTADGGAIARDFYALVRADLKAAASVDAAASLAEKLSVALEKLEALTDGVNRRSGDLSQLSGYATDILRHFAHVSLGWMWVKIAANGAMSDDACWDGKAQTARFFMDRMLPKASILADIADSALKADVMDAAA
ncbi:acyl-CoA dehydrogenase family protein [Rhizobium sp. CF142]|uniref:acyl-CoA dehydrogenase family protein n=1 Tax=Rhizobium sp. CF142 TaxID=1144314 RepID=UPI00026EFEE6|nr:acyl-CoA dehydrogenase family protein [Rhizobium sp. CF142]EJJ29274.1 acyl-CoA dehydrogenase [Rhizobium sp. CF142]